MKKIIKCIKQTDVEVLEYVKIGKRDSLKTQMKRQRNI